MKPWKLRKRLAAVSPGEQITKVQKERHWGKKNLTVKTITKWEMKIPKTKLFYIGKVKY